MVHQMHEKVECSTASFEPRADGWEYEGDQRHVELTVQALILTKSNTASTPGEHPKDEEEGSAPLDEDKVSGYRQLAARANHKAEDRADIQQAVKEVCRGMASSTGCHWKQMKRLGGI